LFLIENGKKPSNTKGGTEKKGKKIQKILGPQVAVKSGNKKNNEIKKTNTNLIKRKNKK